jgi:hypothetical protein
MQVGKKTKEWNQARKLLKIEYESRGITYCERCSTTSFLSFAHRYKRNDPRCEHTFKGTLLLCVPCHEGIEYDQQATEDLFKKLR